ncbi:MTRF1L release factor glutamine methyltransferase [Phymastichus coffea]|uniref:MTRF1L release factor glutamine methyltransferase n=1 Tax=Phymastichus coffea TaxID=108790 RepID=UPI00273C578B|nr:MTRF1L release factor glutamine methyltransferase [Phymastichus coffea]
MNLNLCFKIRVIFYESNMRSFQYLPVSFKRCLKLLTPNSTRTLKKFSDNTEINSDMVQEFVKFSSSANNPSDKHDKQTIANVMKRWQEIFIKENIAEPKESIQHITASIIGITKLSDLAKLQNEQLSEEQLQKLEILCECRLSRMPVQYLIGQWDFRDITLKLEPPIFIPRPETEILVELMLKRMNDFGNKSCEILEIGCGSGAICLSLLQSRKNLRVVAIDINPHACDLTKENAKNLNLEMGLILLNAKLNETGNISVKKNYTSSQPLKFEQLRFDFIVSNPPYIPTQRIFSLQPEVRVYEDIKALNGGNDGLRLIKPILLYASVALNDDGFLILEIDSSHCEQIKMLVEENYAGKLQFESVYKDFNENDRYVEIKRIHR